MPACVHVRTKEKTRYLCFVTASDPVVFKSRTSALIEKTERGDKRHRKRVRQGEKGKKKWDVSCNVELSANFDSPGDALSSFGCVKLDDMDNCVRKEYKRVM
jgi:hypothetical protein